MHLRPGNQAARRAGYEEHAGREARAPVHVGVSDGDVGCPGDDPGSNAARAVELNVACVEGADLRRCPSISMVNRVRQPLHVPNAVGCNGQSEAPQSRQIGWPQGKRTERAPVRHSRALNRTRLSKSSAYHAEQEYGRDGRGGEVTKHDSGASILPPD
jgi:hypothetical protein